jgi:hypothetical protein
VFFLILSLEQGLLKFDKRYGFCWSISLRGQTKKLLILKRTQKIRKNQNGPNQSESNQFKSIQINSILPLLAFLSQKQPDGGSFKSEIRTDLVLDISLIREM